MSTTEEIRKGFYFSEDGDWVPDGWTNRKLDEIAHVIDSLHKTPKYSKVGSPMVRVVDVKHEGLDLVNCLKVSDEVFNEFNKRHTPKYGDIVFTRVGSYGNVAITKEGQRYCLGQNTAFIIPTESSNFLFYFLRSHLGKREIERTVAGSTQKTVSIQSIKNFELKCPDVIEQKAIAAVLGSLDDKIELLREQNETLEALAQTLFKRWFIGFNFPDENGNPYKDSGGKMIPSEFGEIPEGWEIRKLKDFGKIVCGKTPSKAIKSNYGDEVLFIKIPDMHGNVFILRSGEHLSSEGVESQNNKTIPKGSIMVSCIATVGLVALTSSAAQTNQQINSIVPNQKNETEYLFLRLKTLHGFLQNLGAGGSATLNINTTSFSEVKLIRPDDQRLIDFHQLASPLFSKVESNAKQIQTLTQLRDTLLPKLMKGEIRVPIAQ